MSFLYFSLHEQSERTFVCIQGTFDSNSPTASTTVAVHVRQLMVEEDTMFEQIGRETTKTTRIMLQVVCEANKHDKTTEKPF